MGKAWGEERTPNNKFAPVPVLDDSEPLIPFIPTKRIPIGEIKETPNSSCFVGPREFAFSPKPENSLGSWVVAFGDTP